MRVPAYLKERLAYHESEARRRFKVNSLGYVDSTLHHTIQHLVLDERGERSQEFVDTEVLDEIVIQKTAYMNVAREYEEKRHV